MPRVPLTLVLLLSAPSSARPASDYPIQPVAFTDVHLTGGMWQARQDTNRTVTVPHALRQCETSGRLRNFDLAAETMRRRAGGETTFQQTPATLHPFDDSDVFKAIEAASYTLSVHPDPQLQAELDGMIARIAAAQEPDGYLYTFRTMHPDPPVHHWIHTQRWINDPEMSHELYNLGHLYEAGVAHHAATGKSNLLDVCRRSVERLWRDFSASPRALAPGHQGIELALARLFRITGEARCLQLAHRFLEARGPGGPTENQRHQRVEDQREAVGHVVRANYQYAGMADLVPLGGQESYRPALRDLWQDVVTRKLYLTGGVGARPQREEYGDAYELPDDGYNETCAAIALMMWAQRMFLLEGDGAYLDVLERTAYNGFLSGVDLPGTRFFYPNPLVYDGQARNNHGRAGRAPWFGCACCPPNLTRTLAALTGYAYAVRGDELFVNFFVDSTGEARVAGQRVHLRQETRYPWEGDIRLTLAPERPATFALRWRIPGWARGAPVPGDLYTYADSAPGDWSVRVNGEVVTPGLAHGFAVLRREWREGDRVELTLGLPVRRVRAHPAVGSLHDRVALERGPVVYGFEATEEQALPLAELVVPASATVRPVERPELLGGVTTLEITGAGRADGGEVPERLQAIPYATWNNRGLYPMRVWVRAATEPVNR
jgi:uncharacterized protein